MTLDAALFVILAAVTAASALGVALSRSVIHSAVWLLFTLVSLALHYLHLGAEFLAATQMIVYVGGTLVLVVFGVMLTSGGPFATLEINKTQRAAGGLVALALVALCVLAVTDVRWPSTPAPLPDTHALGRSLLGVNTTVASVAPRGYLLPFEIVSIHLLVVLIAAAYLARPKKKTSAGAS
jgi:NADH-quinone oxidoreductase subunit J